MSIVRDKRKTRTRVRCCRGWSSLLGWWLWTKPSDCWDKGG
jgi:hypothetical protein